MGNSLEITYYEIEGSVAERVVQRHRGTGHGQGICTECNESFFKKTAYSQVCHTKKCQARRDLKRKATKRAYQHQRATKRRRELEDEASHARSPTGHGEGICGLCGEAFRKKNGNHKYCRKYKCQATKKSIRQEHAKCIRDAKRRKELE